MPDTIRPEFSRLARLLIETFDRELHVVLRYDEDSLEYLDGYIGRNRVEVRKKTGGVSLVTIIGSFVGECIIANFGGEWKQSNEGAWGVFFDSANAVFPFAKVRKAFDADDNCDSIAGFYRITQLLKEGKLS